MYMNTSMQLIQINQVLILLSKWAFGVTCWEVFSGGKMPYGGLSPLSLSKLLKDGERMEAPDNAACSQEMYVISQ